MRKHTKPKMGWPHEKLGKFCTFLNGGTPSRSVENFFQGNIPWITGADIDGPVVTAARSFITHEAVKKSATNLVPTGTILLVTRTSVGKVAIAGVDLCFSQDITAILPDETVIFPPFLVEMLRTKKDFFNSQARGATIKGITRDVVENLHVPLPPLEEQRRIADILDRADALRRLRRESLARLDELTRSIFLDMFGDPATNPKGWPLKSLPELCDLHSGGTPSKSESENWCGEFPWFSPKDLKHPDLFDSIDHVNEALIKRSIRKLDSNTVVFVVRGMILAHSFPVSVLMVKSIINQDMKALIPRMALDPQFLAFSLRSQEMFILSLVSEAAHGTKRLDSEALSKIKIFHVPYHFQQEFARRVEAVERLKDGQREHLARLDELFASLQHRAFCGEL